MTLKVDKATITKILDESHPKRIAFNAPDGLLPVTRRLASSENLNITFKRLLFPIHLTALAIQWTPTRRD